MLEIVAAMVGQGANPVGPVITISTTRGSTGTCHPDGSSDAATIVTTWNAGITDFVGYTANLYEQLNGGGFNFVQTKTVSPTDHAGTFTRTLTSLTESGTVSQASRTYVYRLDVVRNSDSRVVSSKTGTAWTHNYGGCIVV